MSDYLASGVWGSVQREITQPWGCSAVIVNGRHVEPWWNIADCWWHCGLDVGVVVGTPLYAARAGVVTVAMRGLVKVNVDLGRYSADDCYVHISATNCRVGDHVAQGQLIAYSGNVLLSGGAIIGSGHLHFEVQVGALNNPATSLDPIPVLTPKFTFGSGGGLEMLDAEDPIVKTLLKAASAAEATYGIVGGAHLAGPALDEREAASQALLQTLLDYLKAHSSTSAVSDPLVLQHIESIEAHLNAPRPPA